MIVHRLINFMGFSWFIKNFQCKKNFSKNASRLLLVLILLSETVPVFAGISFSEIPVNLDKATKNFRFNPINGFNALQNKTIENIRFYGNYGQRKDGIWQCQRQILARGDWDNDCPQDHVTAMIQHFFPSPDGAIFVANQGSDTDPVVNLTTKDIGSVLRVIQDFEEKGLKNLINDDYLQLEFSLFEALDPKTRKEKIAPKSNIKNEEKLEASIEAKKSDTLKLYRLFKNDQYQSYLDGEYYTNLKSHLKFSDGLIMTSEKKILEARQNNANPDELEILTKELKKLTAKRESLDKELKKKPTKKSKFLFNKEQRKIIPLVTAIARSVHQQHNAMEYPNDIVQQTLLAFFWRKAENGSSGLSEIVNVIDGPENQWTPDRMFLREDYKELQSAFKDLESDDFLKKVTTLKHRIRNPENEGSKIEKIRMHLSQESDRKFSPVQEISLNPFKLSMLASGFDYFENILPPEISYKSAAYGEHADYSDCVETAIRNFFNIVLYRNGKFDLLVTEDPDQLGNGIKKFYKEFDSPSKAESGKAHDAWSRYVTTDLNNADKPGIKINYRNAGRYEIATSLSNILNVISLNLNDKELTKLSEVSDANPMNRAEKMLDRIVEIFSRDDFQLSWTSKDGVLKENDLILNFSINEKPSFEWNIESGHSYVSMTSPNDIENTFKRYRDLYALNTNCMIPNSVFSYFGFESRQEAWHQKRYFSTMFWSMNHNSVRDDKKVKLIDLTSAPDLVKYRKGLLDSMDWSDRDTVRDVIIFSLKNRCFDLVLKYLTPEKIVNLAWIDTNDPFHLMIDYGSRADLEMLLKKAPVADLLAGPYQFSSHSRSSFPLDYAVRKARPEMVTIISEFFPELIEKNLHVNLNKIPLHRVQDIDMAKILIGRGGVKQIFNHDYKGFTPFHKAIIRGNTELVRYYISVIKGLSFDSDQKRKIQRLIGFPGKTHKSMTGYTGVSANKSPLMMAIELKDPDVRYEMFDLIFEGIGQESTNLFMTGVTNKKIAAKFLAFCDESEKSDIDNSELLKNAMPKIKKSLAKVLDSHENDRFWRYDLSERIRQVEQILENHF